VVCFESLTDVSLFWVAQEQSAMAQIFIFNLVVGFDHENSDLRGILVTKFLNPSRSKAVPHIDPHFLGPTEVVSPHQADAVVMLLSGPRGGVAKSAGLDVSKATLNDAIGGMTFTDESIGQFCEVYWDRLPRLSNVAGAIFHEVAHLKSRMGNDEMHNKDPNFRILGPKGAGEMDPSPADIRFFTKVIGNRTQRLRNHAY
jgi:hypothetical protein